MRFGFNETGTLHRALTAAAFLAMALVPLSAAANPSNGGSQQSNGGSRPAGASTLMHFGGANSVMHQSQWVTMPDRKLRRPRFGSNNDNGAWFKTQPQCNAAMWMQPELVTNVYTAATASCWWQNAPLWVP